MHDGRKAMGDQQYDLAFFCGDGLNGFRDFPFRKRVQLGRSFIKDQ